MEAWIGLADGWLAQDRFEELEQTARRLEREPSTYVAGAVLAARMHLARQEFVAARELLEQAIVRHRELFILGLYWATCCFTGGGIAPARKRHGVTC